MKSLIFAITFIMALANVPISARADTVTDDDTVYTFEFQEPQLDDNSIYIVYLLENTTGYRTVCLQFLSITPRYTTNTDEYVWPDDTFFGLYLGSATSKIYMNVSSTTYARGYSYRMFPSGAMSNFFNESFITQTSATIDWSTSGYTCIGYEVIGSHFTIESGLAGRETFTYLFSDEATMYNTYLDIIQELALNNELQADELELLASMLETLGSNNDLLTTIKGLLVSVDYNTDQLEYYLELIYKNVNNIYNKTDEVEYYLDLLYKQLNQVYNNIDDVEELLQELIDLWTPSNDESKYDEVDTSKQDTYIEMGKDLTSKDTTNQQQDLNIEVDSNAGAYVWDTFNSFLASNAKVIGMYITLLSVAFISLILGR